MATYAAKSVISEAREAFHAALLNRVLRVDSKGIPSNADKDSKTSVGIAVGIFDQIKGATEPSARLAGQISGTRFEKISRTYVEATFLALRHLRPGSFDVHRKASRLAIADYEQYQHLADLDALARQNESLAAALGSDYLIKPDILIARLPEPDDTINSGVFVVDTKSARLTGLRRLNNDKPLLHASISCKWTLRSDRAQNTRSEGLSLVRNRKGRLPHIVVVTGEPVPSRIASIALGTGDIDCVYHFALPELLEAARPFDDAFEMLNIMISGKRLRDISDLPLDLVT